MIDRLTEQETSVSQSHQLVCCCKAQKRLLERSTMSSAPSSSESDIISLIPGKVERLRNAFHTGRTRSYEWRKTQLEALVRFTQEREGDIMEALRLDLGKCKFEAVVSEVAALASSIKDDLNNLKKWMQPRKVATPLVQMKGLSTAQVVLEPKGVVLVIGTWNYPIQLTVDGVAGALAAGNCVVLKVSEVSEHSSKLLEDVLPRYLDPECFQVIGGAVPETTALLKQKFDHILYTGNGIVGKIVMRAAAEHLTPVTLELGGKSPTIVDKDVDLGAAARRIIWGKCTNAGQTCIAPDYVLVHKDIKKALLEAFQKALTDFYGSDVKSSPDYGRIINRRHFQRLIGLLETEKDKVVVGGESDIDKLFIAPTILDGVSPDAPIMKDEIFGPILPILTVNSIDDAIKFVNERPKPLALYIFTTTPSVWQKVIDTTSSGQLVVNDTIMQFQVNTLPFGGVGDSGIGQYHGIYGFETFSHQKAVLNKTTWFDMDIRYPPFSDRKLSAVLKLL